MSRKSKGKGNFSLSRAPKIDQWRAKTNELSDSEKRQGIIELLQSLPHEQLAATLGQQDRQSLEETTRMSIEIIRALREGHIIFANDRTPDGTKVYDDVFLPSKTVREREQAAAASAHELTAELYSKTNRDVMIPALLNIGALDGTLKLMIQAVSYLTGAPLRQAFIDGELDKKLVAQQATLLGHFRDLNADPPDLSWNETAREFLVSSQQLVNGVAGAEQQMRDVVAAHTAEDIQAQIGKMTERVQKSRRPSGPGQPQAFILKSALYIWETTSYLSLADSADAFHKQLVNKPAKTLSALERKALNKLNRAPSVPAYVENLHHKYPEISGTN
jgi:hypothetical protein